MSSITVICKIESEQYMPKPKRTGRISYRSTAKYRKCHKVYILENSKQCGCSIANFRKEPTAEQLRLIGDAFIAGMRHIGAKIKQVSDEHIFFDTANIQEMEKEKEETL
jgi:hypothetical protein